MIQLNKRAMVLSLVIVSSLFVFHFTQSIKAQAPAASASILFSPETISVNSGETFSTQLWIDTDGAAVGGVGAKVNFDSALLSVEKIETQSVFPDYPATTFDNNTGKVVISGIVNSKDELYTGKAQFATIHWKAKSSGEASITLDFVPNQTSDSNIAVLYGNGDILQKVNAVSVQVSTNDQFAPATDESSTTQLASDTPTTLSNTNSMAVSPLVMGLGLVTLLSLALNAFLFLKVRRSSYKEEIPHIQTPPVIQQ